MKAGDARAIAALISALGGFGLAALILCAQILSWLKVGSWPELSLATILIPISSGSRFHDWLLYPESWYGLHSIVKFLVGLPLFVWVSCCTSAAVFLLLSEKRKAEI
jgi:hypothetical protein